MVLHLAINRDTAHTEIACGTQPEPGIGRPVRGRTRHVERERVVSRNHRHPIGDMLPRPAPRAVAVEINPRIQLRRAALHVYRRRGPQRAGSDRPEGHAVFVVGTCRVVAVGTGRVQAVGFRVASRAQRGTGGHVLGSALGQERLVRQRRVPEVRGEDDPPFQQLQQRPV